MGHTIIEKIIGRNIGKEVKPGDIVTVNVDRVMIHDIFIPFVKEKFGQEEINKALVGQKNDIEIMVTYYPKINEYNGNTQIQIIIDRFC